MEQPDCGSIRGRAVSTSTVPGRLAPYTRLSEPLLAFSSADPSKVDAHPLRGIVSHGPYSKNSLASYTDRVRVAIVGPQSGMSERRRILRNVQNPQQPSDRRDYVPPFPGFEALFHVPLRPAAGSAQLTWPARLEELGAGLPTDRVRRAISERMRALAAVRDQFDVAVVHLPDGWGPGLRGDAFNAHDELKAIGAELGIPTQGLNDRTFTFRVRSVRRLAPSHSAVRQGWRNAVATRAAAGRPT